MKHELCKYSELESFEAYLVFLSSPIDSFLEEHILESQFYRIVTKGREIGFFAAHHGSLLTQFHLVAGERRYGQEVLADILGKISLGWPLYRHAMNSSLAMYWTSTLI